MKKLLFALLAISLSACQSTDLSIKDKSYNPSTDARVRIFGQNGRPSSMKVEINGQIEKITVGGSAGQAMASLLGMKGNEPIGMPETPLSKDPSQLSNIGSGAFFKEFVVPAGKEITVKNSIQTPPHKFENVATGITTVTYKHCSGNEVTFVPVAGKDYEVAPSSNLEHCGVLVYEIK